MKYLLPLLLFLIFACTPTIYTARNFTELSLGHGGGFTGAETRYIISADGKVHKGEGLPPELNLIGTLSKKTLQKLDEKLKATNLPGYTYQQPGNYNHFIELRQNSQLHRIVWADGNEEEVRQDVREFYEWLINEMQQPEEKSEQ